jgi:PAS domain S-box-containing protein
MDKSPGSQFNDDFYKNILESLEDYGVFTMDKSGIVTSWNKGAEHILGYTEEEICGQKAEVVFTEEDCRNNIPEHEFAEALQKGRGLDERYHQKKDGSLFWASGLVFPLFDSDNHHIGFTKILRNLSRRKEAEDEAVEARRYAQSIVQTSREPILILNPDLTINSASKAFFKLFNIAKEDSENKNLFEVLEMQLPPNALQEEMQHYDSFENFELRYLPKGIREERILLISCRKVFQTFKSVGQFLLTFEDITLQEKLSQAKEDFINVASHELKTPIAVIKSYAQILNMELRDTADELVTKTLDRILVQSEKLTALTSMLLDASAFKAGNINLKRENFVLLALVSEIVQEINYSNTKHHLKIEDITDVVVYADKFRISQVLTNLLTNAIKYSPEAELIVIHINVDEANQKVRTTIIDYGIGISPENQAGLFKRFSRTDSEKPHKIEGFGMGLYIAAEIMKLHGGEIGVSSAINEGSTFFFDLPLLP